MKEPDPGGYKYLGVLELDTILCKEMKLKVKNEYLRRLTLLLKSQLNGRNLFSAINRGQWRLYVTVLPSLIGPKMRCVNWTEYPQTTS